VIIPKRFRAERLMVFSTLHNTVSHAVKRREAFQCRRKAKKKPLKVEIQNTFRGDAMHHRYAPLTGHVKLIQNQ